jgi:transposase
MMAVACAISTPDLDAQNSEFHWQAQYYRAQHARAVQREAAWKKEALALREVVRQQAAQIKELNRQVEQLTARVGWLEQQLFGRKSEQTQQTPAAPDVPNGLDATAQGEDGCAHRRNRGQQPGAKGHGRKRHGELRAEAVVHDLAEDQKCCPRCGEPLAVFPGTEDGEQIEWEVDLFRRIHRRRRYRPTCLCQVLPGIVTAPAPPKLIPKGKFANSFWVQLLLEKYLFQRPLYRILKGLELEGLHVSPGTLTGGLRRLGELLRPLYVCILEHSRTADHWHMDETRWMVFAEVAGKVGHRWWLWVVVTRDTCAYILDPSRSATVPKAHLGQDAEGIISADRYTAYGNVADKIRVAYCWAHVRRDFIRIRDHYENLRQWSRRWMGRIGEVFDLNAKRVGQKRDSKAFGRADQALRDALAAMAKACERELADPNLHAAQRKALESLCRHWPGLTIFVDHPEIPMDNNEAERRLRNPVLGRKNYYGSGSIWSGLLSMVLFTILQTLLINHINPKLFLLDYFEACARNGGRAPDNIDDFLPWNFSGEKKSKWKYAEQPP